MGRLPLSLAPPIYAHSLPGRPPADWETLADHASAVAALARDFAAAFGAAEWGELLGRWHDLGKIQPEFQVYIRGGTPSGPPHAWVGAVHAYVQSKRFLPIAAAIAAHHGALADLKGDEASGVPVGGTLSELLRNRQRDFSVVRALLPIEPTTIPVPVVPRYVAAVASDALRVELFTRFLYSALIDADRLATARFYCTFQAALTTDDMRCDDIATLAARLDAHIDAMAPKGSAAVVELRRQVLSACRAMTQHAPGRFSLTVPTGGGKTLSAMSFALNHARSNNLRRVIVVIPYTSIIEQSARVYRDALNDPDRPDVNNVLEHHSNLDEQRLGEQDARGEDLRKLAAENWKSPVVVTTTVQFFESLLAAHGSRCRKVHNIARSVVLLDEVQTLPPQYLRTIVDLLKQLTEGYGCSVILSTATPPALVKREGSPIPGLNDVFEIMPDPSALATSARRVRIEWRLRSVTPYADLATELRGHHQALAIVHRRADARVLAEAIGDESLHLSALMCPAHRLRVINDVRDRLARGDRCLLISTQLIEAGVDVDFPIVYRALGGLDSIAQSAGRCDREGRLTAAAGGVPGGRMIVFLAETEPPMGVPTKAFDSMRVLLGLGSIDPFEPNDSIRFFRELYGKAANDPRDNELDRLRRALAFATVEEKFKMIDAVMHPIVVPWGEGRARLAAYRRSLSRDTRRALQTFTVQVRRYALDQLRDAGVCMPVEGNNGTEFFDAVNEGREGRYHERFGLDVHADGIWPAEDSVV
ncbi:MAG TPA: CRISPR-associated endonuclease Cas3'' [Planctomycetales bacterium]|jgi:CRISPR-associated endonuclease/helicase Cas3|nr:CRISPR-associated endonuclease Cas3'' [Planctomycetales bacterium]